MRSIAAVPEGRDRPRQIKLRRKCDARQTRDDEARRYGGTRNRFGISQGIRPRLRDVTVRQRRTTSGEISAETPDDRPDQPAAATRDAVLRLQRGRHYAEQFFFRPLSPGR